jgi:hypothetical protein
MPKHHRSRSPRADVVARLRQLETLCTSQTEATEHAYFLALGQVLDVLAVALEGTRDPLELLTVVGTLARQNAEEMLLHRVRVWRGMASATPRE